MRLDDCPITARLDRATLESLALAFARRELELTELGELLSRQQQSLAEMRGQLLSVLWPRTPA